MTAKTMTAVRRKLPGKPRPAAEVLAEYRKDIADLRTRVPAPLWPIFASPPDGHYR